MLPVLEPQPYNRNILGGQAVFRQKFGVHALGVSLAFRGRLAAVGKWVPEGLDGPRELAVRVLSVYHQLVVRVPRRSAVAVALQHDLKHLGLPRIAVAPYIRLADAIAPRMVHISAAGCAFV